MRVVLDTNVLARAVSSPTGPAGELLDWVRRDHLLVISLEMLSELSRALCYERLRRIHQLDDDEIKQVVEEVQAISLVPSLPDPVPRVVPADPDDDYVVATAVAGECEVICTRNRHLFDPVVVAYCRQRAIKIADDTALLERMRQKQIEREQGG
jgi:putative PIN family toxin of toxin-antitoxin system